MLTPGSCFGRLRKWFLSGWAKLSGWVAYISGWPWFLRILHSLGFKHMKYLSSPEHCVISCSTSFQTKPCYEKSAATPGITQHTALLPHLSYTRIWTQMLEYKTIIWLLTQHDIQWFAKLNDLIQLNRPELWTEDTNIQDHPTHLATLDKPLVFSGCTVFPLDRTVTPLCWIWVIRGQLSSHFGPGSAKAMCHLCTDVQGVVLTITLIHWVHKISGIILPKMPTKTSFAFMWRTHLHS